MTEFRHTSTGRYMGLIWLVALAGPIAWFAGFFAMFWLTRPACESGSRVSMGWVGAVAAILAAAALLLAGRFVRRAPVAEAPSLRFLSDLARWWNAIFLLVIALSLVPVFLLSPCGV